MSDKEELIRFGVAFPATLIEQFDRYIENQGYKNRSEAIRDMARRSLLNSDYLQSDKQVGGTIVMVYDHHVSELPLILTELQHGYHHLIISTMHIHLSHTQCLEVLAVRGRLDEMRSLHQQLQVLKGVNYAELSVTYIDEDGHHGHGHPGHGQPGHEHP
jgi:CopG family transcriptional regulator, nickel-responsive regulator